MKIHSDILIPQDILAAVPDGCYLAVFNQPGFGRTRIGREGSRKREKGFIVRLSGSSKHNMRNLPDKSATWDEWGVFIDALYSRDPNALIGFYGSREKFIKVTTEEYERCKRYRRDLDRRAPWLRDVHAAEMGYDAGKAAGSWVIDGNTSVEQCRAILKGYEKGDPKIMYMEPSPLSGEWANSTTPNSIAADFKVDPESGEAADLFDAYEEAFSRGYWDEVIRSAKYQTEEVS